MSVNPDGMTSGVANEFVDLEHQVIRQKLDVVLEQEDGFSGEVLPGNPAAEFDPGERKLDREEIAQLVAYRRYATVNFLNIPSDPSSDFDFFAIMDASVGINGDLFRPVTTKENFLLDGEDLEVDAGGEIGLLDHYQIYAQPMISDASDGVGGGGINSIVEHTIDFYDWPTGGPIVDSFDTITCGFGASVQVGQQVGGVECQFELRYDFWWDVAEQGRSTNPFGRPSTR
jgi:hypothetical protein